MKRKRQEPEWGKQLCGFTCVLGTNFEVVEIITDQEYRIKYRNQDRWTFFCSEKQVSLSLPKSKWSPHFDSVLRTGTIDWEKVL